VSAPTKIPINITVQKEGEIEVSILTLETNKISKNLRIVQLSDLHFGPCTNKKTISKAINITNDLKPDLITMTGDYVQFSTTGIRHILATKVSPKLFKWTEYRREVRKLCKELSNDLSKLENIENTYATFGNHDYHEGLGTIVRQFPKEMNWLVNKTKDLENITISGLDDFRLGHPDISSLKPKKENFNLLLSHNPDALVMNKEGERIEKTSLEKFDLVLCGHTHGGQICLPNKKPIISRTKQKSHIKELSYNGKTPVYVTRGLGRGGLPIRLNCPAEIVLIQLKAI